MKKAVFFVGMFFAVSSILVSQDSYTMSVNKEFKIPQPGQYLSAEDVMNIKAALETAAWMSDMYKKENESLKASYKQISDAYSTLLNRLDEFKRESGLVLYKAGRVAVFGPTDLDAVNMSSGEHFNRVETVSYWNSAMERITSSANASSQSQQQNTRPQVSSGSGSSGSAAARNPYTSPSTTNNPYQQQPQYPGVAGPVAPGYQPQVQTYQPPVQQYQPSVAPVPQQLPYSDPYAAASAAAGAYVSPYGPPITSYGDTETIANRLRASEPISATPSATAAAPAASSSSTTARPAAGATGTATTPRPATGATGTTTTPRPATPAAGATGTTTPRPATPATGATGTTTPRPATGATGTTATPRPATPAAK